MSEQYDVHGEQVEDEKRASVKRRGLIAGAAALVAAAIAKQAASPVEAQGEPLVVGNNANAPGYQSASSMTWVVSTVAGNPGLRFSNNFPNGTAFDTVSDGIQGYAANPDMTKSNAGVFGRVNDLDGVGIFGEGPNGTGVFGDSASGSGVAGNSSSGAGVYGQSFSGTGVVGLQLATSGGGQGLYGSTNSPGGYGLLAAQNAAGGTAVTGIIDNTKQGSVAFAGVASKGNYAGFFTGDVAITGALTVSGGKSALVNHPLTGDNRLLYCVESPDSWFEDFGEGNLVNGKADVALDPHFTALIHTDSYHVFLTDHDGQDHPTVTKRGPTGFTVEAEHQLAVLKGKSSSQLNGTFSWRVVGKRSDINLERFAKYELPKVKLPTLADLPKPPKVPASRKQRP